MFRIHDFRLLRGEPKVGWPTTGSYLEIPAPVIFDAGRPSTA
jgi:hypothetical protein